MCVCGNKNRGGQRNCLACHAASSRKNRPKYSELTPLQKKKNLCRSYANVYKRRGKLIQQACEKCEDPDSEMHHEDYDKPLEVIWLCRPCHIKRHEEDQWGHLKLNYVSVETQSE